MAVPSPSMRAARRYRPPLTRERIVGTALALARGEDIDAVSMRRLAGALDTAPTSLYRHLPDREQLLLAMLDEVAAGVEIPAPVADPRTEIAGLVGAVHQALRRDPWVVQVLVVDRLASPAILPLAERVLAALERAGLTTAEAGAAYALLWHYVYGEAVSARHDRPDTVARQMAHAAGPEFPAIARLLTTMPAAGPRDLFTANLHRLLDGVLGPR